MENGLLSPQERIPERICEQIWDVQLPQVVEQVLVGPKIPSRDRILQGTVEQILGVPVPEMVEQLVKLPKTVSEDGIQQRTVERIVRHSSSAGCGRTGGGLQDFSLRTGFNNISEDRPSKTLGVPLAEKIVEMPVTQTCVAYAGDDKIAGKDLVVTRLTRMSLTLDFPASLYESVM